MDADGYGCKGCSNATALAACGPGDQGHSPRDPAALFGGRQDPDRAGATETALMCRVSDDGPSRCERLALGPSSESLQGRNPREVGHGAAARTMGISKGRSKMLASMKCVMDRR